MLALRTVPHAVVFTDTKLLSLIPNTEWYIWHKERTVQLNVTCHSSLPRASDTNWRTPCYYFAQYCILFGWLLKEDGSFLDVTYLIGCRVQIRHSLPLSVFNSTEPRSERGYTSVCWRGIRMGTFAVAVGNVDRTALHYWQKRCQVCWSLGMKLADSQIWRHERE